MSNHEPTILLGRREFTARGILLLLSGVTVFVSACSGGGSSSPMAPSAPTPTSPADVTGSISANHGHVAVITGVQLSAGNQVTLNIQGSADHNHTVDLSAGEVMQIADHQRVSKLSSTTQAHQHTVTFN